MSLSPSVRQLWRMGKSTPQKAEVKKQQVEKTWDSLSVLALFSNLQRTHKRANWNAHPHTHADATQVYTHTMNTHEHTHTHTALPNSTLLMCEMSKGLISWKHTTEPEEKEREGDTQREKREKKKKEEEEGEKDWEREREGGVTWRACWWLWTWESAAYSGGLRLKYYQPSVPLLHPYVDLTKHHSFTYTHTHTQS